MAARHESKSLLSDILFSSPAGRAGTLAPPSIICFTAYADPCWSGRLHSRQLGTFDGTRPAFACVACVPKQDRGSDRSRCLHRLSSPRSDHCGSGAAQAAVVCQRPHQGPQGLLIASMSGQVPPLAQVPIFPWLCAFPTPIHALAHTCCTLLGEDVLARACCGPQPYACSFQHASPHTGLASSPRRVPFIADGSRLACVALRGSIS